jgi:hypothetical protein
MDQPAKTEDVNTAEIAGSTRSAASAGWRWKAVGGAGSPQCAFGSSNFPEDGNGMMAIKGSKGLVNFGLQSAVTNVISRNQRKECTICCMDFAPLLMEFLQRVFVGASAVLAVFVILWLGMPRRSAIAVPRNKAR